MHHLLNDRRTFIAFFAIACLTALGIYTVDASVAMALAATAAAVASANAFENSKKKSNENKE